MEKKTKNYICPQCGNKEPKQFSLEHETDVRDNLVVCKKCGKKGAERLFSTVLKPVRAGTNGSFSDNMDKMPSNKPVCVKKKKTRDNDMEFRTNSEERVTKDPENVRRVSMINPFVKTKKIASYNPFVKKAFELFRHLHSKWQH